MNKVYFVNSRSDLDWDKIAKGEGTYFDTSASLLYKFDRLIDKSGILDDIKPIESVGIKMHWGDLGTTRTIRSLYVKKLAEKIKEKGAFAFVTESSGLGLTAPRCYGVGRLQIAQNNGYTSETCGAPLIPADGLKGLNDIVVDVDGAILKRVHIAGILKDVDKIISLAHLKGHPGLGLGGALKNIAVGFAAKASKWQFHIATDWPEYNKEICTDCKKCVEICPTKAISNSIEIDTSKCEKCLGCVEVCRSEGSAMSAPWTSGAETANRMIDIFKAVQDYVGRENIRYINFLMDITPICDCIPSSDNPIVPDIGIMISKDPLAIDKASLDLVNKAQFIEDSKCSCVENKFETMYEGTFNANPKLQMDAAQKLNIGSLDYKLIEL